MGTVAPIPPAIREALSLYRETLEARFHGRVRDFRLYGSRARGTAHEGSDTDVFVVIADATREELRVAVALAGDVLDETEISLSPVAYSPDDVERLATMGSPYLRSVMREGITL